MNRVQFCLTQILPGSRCARPSLCRRVSLSPRPRECDDCLLAHVSFHMALADILRQSLARRRRPCPRLSRSKSRLVRPVRVPSSPLMMAGPKRAQRSKNSGTLLLIYRVLNFVGVEMCELKSSRVLTNQFEFRGLMIRTCVIWCSSMK